MGTGFIKGNEESPRPLVMFVFPANDEAYRKRKRVHKACEQCKRRRKRCDFPLGSVRCEPCEKADILCSLAPEYELPEKEVRLDSLAMRSIVTRDAFVQRAPGGTSASALGQRSVDRNLIAMGLGSSALGQSSVSLGGGAGQTSGGISSNINPMGSSSQPNLSVARPGLSRASSASLLGSESKARKTSSTTGPWGSHKEEEDDDTSNVSASATPGNGAWGARPRLGPRALSYTATQRTEQQSNGLSPPENNIPNKTGRGHRRAGSHSPGLSKMNSPGRPFTPLESLFVGRMPSVQQPGEAIDRENIGVWVKGVTSKQQLDPYLHTYLSSINAFSMPLRPDREALIQLYYESIDRLLPLVDMNEVTKLHRIGQAPTLLLHAVLLAAARHPRARQHLGHQSTRQFCASTAAKIRALLFAEVEQDRLTLVRVYALLSLHSEGPDGLENSCSDLERALHYAISLGLHHERPFVEKAQLKKLFWSLWCMDRLSACVNARPLIVNIEDVGIKTIDPQEHPQLSRLIQACWKLEKVIYLYRPMAQGPCAPPVPLEVDELFMGDDTVDSLNAVHALLHHTAFILAHKRVSETQDEESVVSEVTEMTAPTVSSGLDAAAGRSGDRTSSTLHTPLTMMLAEEKFKMRPATSASSIKTESPYADSLMDEFLAMDSQNASAGNQSSGGARSFIDRDTLLLSAAGSVLRIITNSRDLPPLPLIPYSVSLTLTVFLRMFPRYDSETGFGWRDSCIALEAMADRWWVAGAMGSMGWNLFKSLEEAANNNMNTNSASNNNSNTSNNNNSVGSKGANQLPANPEELYLNMFSDMPNQTSFIDQALTLDGFDDVDKWLEEKLDVKMDSGL